MTARLTATALGHAFTAGSPLFRSLSFDLLRGEVVGLCGPSGCGKSTLLSLLAGWEQPSEGRLERVGISRTGWVFQNPHGVSGRSALDHVTLPLIARGYSRGRADTEGRCVLERFGLDRVADRPFRALSGGEAQRLMLARAVTAAPDLLLVDEPTAQLDTRTAREINETLARVAEGGSIVVVATHDPDTRAACDRVIDLVDFAPAAEGLAR